MNVQKNIIQILTEYNIDYTVYDHEAIISYEDAERQKQQLGWSGVESKNVFMKGKSGKYFLYVTTQGNNVDFKAMKELVGEKLSIATVEDVETIACCSPGCVAPFGLSSDIITIVDTQIFKHIGYLFSPGLTTQTIELDPSKLQKIFQEMQGVIFI